MLLAAVYDLCVARPHEPEGARFTTEQYALYRTGYDMALVKALQAMNFADRRYRLRVRTLQLQARNERSK